MKGDGGGREEVATAAPTTAPPADVAMAELLTRIMSMDPREAHRQMCLAQDEVERLRRQARREPSDEAEVGHYAAETENHGGGSEPEPLQAREAAAAASVVEAVVDPSTDDGGTRTSNGGAAHSPSPPSPRKQRSDRHIKASGALIELGGRLCAEFLPNVGRLQLTLTGLEGLELDVSDGRLSLTSTGAGRLSLASSVEEDREALLEVELPKTLSDLVIADGAASAARVSSVDSDSLSIRMQLPSGNDGADLAEELTGGCSAVSSNGTATRASDLSRLRCRNCRSSIADLSSNFRTALPLPSGYWDEISDYLVCYEGQTAVDFDSSSVRVVPGMALEDDAVLVLHRSDLDEDGGILD